jgi:hypothetical protein
MMKKKNQTKNQSTEFINKIKQIFNI